MGSGKSRKIDLLIEMWKDFAKRSGRFDLNPDTERVKMLAEGVLSNEKLHGLKYCPCRMTIGNRQEDLKLICPCNFMIQETWLKKGECWCSLFVKR